jgi:hypothetical protein
MERHEQSAFLLPLAGKQVRAAFDGGRLTSDPGALLLLAEIERHRSRHALSGRRSVTSHGIPPEATYSF